MAEAHTADTSARESRAFFLRIFPDLASFRISFPNFRTAAENFKLVRLHGDVFFFFLLSD